MGFNFPQDDTSIFTDRCGRPSRYSREEQEKQYAEREARETQRRERERREEKDRIDAAQKKSVDERISILFDDSVKSKSRYDNFYRVWEATQALHFLTLENRKKIELEGDELIKKHNYYPSYEKAYRMALELKLQAFDHAVDYCHRIIDADMEACGNILISKFWGMELNQIDTTDSTGHLLDSLYRNNDMNAV